MPTSYSSGPPPAKNSIATMSTKVVFIAPKVCAVTERSSIVDKVSGKTTRKGEREKVRLGVECWTTERGGESVVTVLKQLCPF